MKKKQPLSFLVDIAERLLTLSPIGFFCRTVQTIQFSHIVAFNMSTSRHIIQIGLIALLVGEFWNQFFFHLVDWLLLLWICEFKPHCGSKILIKKYWMIKWQKMLHSLVISLMKRWLYCYILWQWKDIKKEKTTM